MKGVVFVTGAVSRAVEELPRVGDRVAPGELRVVVAAGKREQFCQASGLPSEQLLAYSPARWVWVWLRLLWFLGWSGGAHVVCLAAGNSAALKLMAFALRGRVMFARAAAEAVTLTLPQFLGLAWKSWGRRSGAICLVGTAGREQLEQILADLRRRYPGTAIHALLPARADGLPADSLAPLSARALLEACRRQPRFVVRVIACTGDGYRALKLLAWCLPLGCREIYNENGDFCSAREVHVLLRHVWWRISSTLDAIPGQLGWRLRLALWRLRVWLTSRPERVTVLGSASGLYLKKIVADLRRRHPGAPIHALLPARRVGPAGRLFDSYTVLRPLANAFWRDLFSLSLGGRRSGYLVIPCTDEGCAGLKLVGFWLPLGLREIYNENGDACRVRDLRMMARHCLWRLGHSIFYQALVERRGRPWPLHVVHLLLYPWRLAAGAALLAAVRVRVGLRGRLAPSARPAREPAGVPAEDMLAAAGGGIKRGAPVVSSDS